MLAQLLNEMDGIEPLLNVTVIAATNRPDLIDPALMRPGRIDRIMYVAPPDETTRAEILRIQQQRCACSPNIDWEAAARQLSGCSGAEVVQCVQEAAVVALERDPDALQITQDDLNLAIARVPRRISSEMLSFYKEYRQKSRCTAL